MSDRALEYAVFSLLKDWKGVPMYDLSIEPLFGDASGRLYHRVRFGKVSVILMTVAHTKPGEFGRGDAWADFLGMQKFLAAAGLPVPAVLHTDPEERRALLEDLGDLTLFAHISADPSRKMKDLRMALDLLISWQRAMWKRRSFNSPADGRSFTTTLFMEEFYHFYEYMIERRVYHPSYKGLWRKLEKRFRRIAQELGNAPALVSHRDFQSKNIMIVKGRPRLIDFQDALLAPIVYDPVALLRDSYVELSADELDHLLDHYWRYNEVARESLPDAAAFRRLFFLQTLQRKMKDAGRFIYLHQVKGKEWFVPFVRPSLFYVRDALVRLGLDDLRELLAPYIPELGDGGRS
ncbi:MAG TPA: phosphotransferase [bacterium]|nr:phosphotransferase [bacterium]